jgi:hypothetical protein
MATFKKGDFVRYFPVMKDRSEHSDSLVDEVYENGIPSCREPMLKLKSKPGLVLASHCEPGPKCGAPHAGSSTCPGCP